MIFVFVFSRHFEKYILNIRKNILELSVKIYIYMFSPILCNPEARIYLLVIKAEIPTCFAILAQIHIIYR